VTEILYLSGREVPQLLPSAGAQLALVEATLASMRNGGTQLPPKPAIHPRADSFIHAMPAYLADRDVAAVKWIGGSSANGERGLPYLSGLIIVNDPETGAPTAIIDAADITAARTAAVTALCVSRFAAPGWSRVAIVGFGVQGRAHTEILRALNDEVEIVITGTSREGPEHVREAVRGADVVVTAIRFARPAQPFVRAEWIEDSQLLIPIDFDAAIEPAAVRDAQPLIVDHLPTFAYYRTLGYFEGWPDPELALADALELKIRPPGAVCCNLGVATLDAAFAEAVIQAARARGSGTILN
jgi:alanine dehydrogenase